MPNKQKVVHCKITFEDGKVVSVRDMKGGKDVEKTSVTGPIPNDGECTVMVLAGDDPCVIQGTTKWCW